MGIVISGFFSYELSEKFLKKVKKKYSMIVVILPDFAKRHESKFEGCEVYCRDKLRVGDLDNVPVPAPHLGKFLTHSQLINVITMYERMWLFETPRPSVILELIGSILSFTKQILDKDIAVVLSRERPHFPFEYCLSVLASNINFRCFGTAEYLRPENADRGTLIFDGPGDDANVVKYRLNNNVDSQKIYENAITSINKRISGDLDLNNYFKGTFGKSKKLNSRGFISKGLNYLLKVIFGKRAKYMILRGYELSRKDKNYDFVTTIIKLIYLSSKYQRFYLDNCIKQMPVKKYILFLGCYQPEETSNPSGNGWHNLLSTFLHVKAQLCQREFVFLYKEHPAVFKSPSSQRIYRGPSSRNKRFYEKLLENNIKFVDHKTDTIGLIKNSSGVVMINGTSMIDATVLEKPTLFFGRSWFCQQSNKDLKVFIDELGRNKISDVSLTADSLKSMIASNSQYILSDRKPCHLLNSLGR